MGRRKRQSQRLQGRTHKLNGRIKHVRTLIADGYHQLIQQKKTVTVDSVKAIYLGTGQNEHTLIKLGQYHNAEMKDRLAEGTM